jgi:beta-phosphoglucomutase-like phosphatase (HAD superfamily)
VLRIPASVTRTTTRAAALLLDMDGTLVDSDAVVERLWTEWALAHGVDPAHTLDHPRPSGAGVDGAAPPGPPARGQPRREPRPARRRDGETDGVVAIPAPPTSSRRSAACRTRSSLGDPAARAGAHGCRGLPIPEVAVAAEDVSRSKPDPEAFLAARRLGVEPRDCIVVEDSRTASRRVSRPACASSASVGTPPRRGRRGRCRMSPASTCQPAETAPSP